MENKSCCCRLFSCFACFSDENTTPSGAQPEPSEIAPVDAFHVTSTAAPNATGDALTHPHHGPQPIASSTSSEARTSTDVLIESNDSQPIVQPDLSCSSQPNTSPLALPAHYQEGSSSSNDVTNHHNVADYQLQGTSSSSSVSKASDLTKNTTASGAQPDPSEIAPVDPNSYVTSTAASNATHDALTHPHHGPQPIVPPFASTSPEARTSTYVPTELNDPQSIVQPDLSPSSQPNTSPLAFTAHDKDSQEGSASSNAATNIQNVADNQLQGTPSSSRVSKVSDLINNILTTAKAVDTENVDADLDGLIEYISHLLELIKEKEKTGKISSNTEGAKDYWQGHSGSLGKFREILSEGINVFKDTIPGEAKTAIQGLLKGMGMAQLASTGLLVVALVLERFETVSANRDECLSVLGEICKLAQHAKKLQQRPGLRERMEASIKDATGLIVKASIMCSTQIGSSKGWRFLSASRNNEKLLSFQQKLERMYRDMDSAMLVCVYDATACRQVRPQKPRERPYPDYAVGIEKPVEEIIELLDWESDKNAVAVILHGFGGMGKTTVADAVFARLYIEGCNYSMVRLFDDVTSTPRTSDIVKLQQYILKDLKMGTLEETEASHIRTPEEGQREIGRILQKEKAFIYVDNVLGRYAFEQLLPKDMDKAKKLRLLITTRDTDVSRECRKLKTKIYPMKGLPHEAAKSLLEKEMYSETDNVQKQLSSDQLDHIVEMCGYIPKLLTVVAGFISCLDDKQKAYRIVKEEKEKNWKGEIGKDITHYVFACQNLDERLKDPFLDICSFFKGRNWSEVGDIIGDGELNSLEKRALVTRDSTSRVWVHDVILAMGLQQTEGTRFTSKSQIKEFLDQKEDKDIRKIKGIELSGYDYGQSDPLYISASKLDLMCNSLRVFIAKSMVKMDGKCTNIFEKLVYLEAEVSNLSFDVSRSKELRYLDLVDLNKELTPSNVEELSRSVSKLQSLKVLRLYGWKSLRQLPEDCGSLTSLQNLHLDTCESLEALPSSLGKLSALQVLDLRWCKRLKVLPSSLGKLSLLRSLGLCGCESLKDLPYDLGKLSSLAELGLNGCEELGSIPESIGQLKSLGSSINLWRTGLKELPDGFCNLSFITDLQMGYCVGLEKLPVRFGEVTSLRKLGLRYCKRLKKLPESFGQLKYLEHLDLSECTILEELCKDFNGLSSLRVLSLDSCKMLKKLPEDFDCLTSLEVLSLRDCHMLEGKWMEGMVKMKTLQIVNIRGSPMLEESWEEIQREGDQSWTFVVCTGQGSTNEHVLKQLHSKLDSILTNGRVTDLPLNTLLLVMFDGNQKFIKNSYFSTINFIEENIDDIQTNFEMIYFGNNFDKFPKKMADRILDHAPANSNAQALFQKVLSAIGAIGAESNWRDPSGRCFEMSAKIVSDEKGDKYLSCWELLSLRSVEEFVIKKCGRYLKLKQMVEKGGESNIELLRELLASGEEESTLTFVKNDAAVRVEELEGKTILLNIWPTYRFYDIPLQSLMEMYVAEKDRLNFEIITIPIVQFRSTEPEVLQVPWLLLQNPRQLKSVIKFFLVEECAEWFRESLEVGRSKPNWDRWHPSIMRVIETNGTIAPHNPAALRMVNTWGAKAYPFTEEKIKELEGEERNQMKAMSNLMFLFNNQESLWDKVKEVMVNGKMICLYTSSKGLEGLACSIRNVLIEFSDNIHMVYIPQFNPMSISSVNFTRSIVTMEWRDRKKLHKMPQIETEMHGLSTLNLSEHEAMRFWARICSLKECINGMDDIDEQSDGIKRLLYSLHEAQAKGYSWMAIMDEEGEFVTTLEKETIENPKDKPKELIQQLVNCPKECRKEILVELEQLQV